MVQVQHPTHAKPVLDLFPWPNQLRGRHQLQPSYHAQKMVAEVGDEEDEVRSDAKELDEQVEAGEVGTDESSEQKHVSAEEALRLQTEGSKAW